MSDFIVSQETENVNREILKDCSASGRENPWREKKLENEKIAAVYRWLDENTDCGVYWAKKAERLEQCGNTLIFDLLASKETGEVKKRLAGANFCRVRLCPMCGWRRARKVQAQMYQICTDIMTAQSVRWLFLTLTVPNCEGAALSSTLDEMFAAWRRLQYYPEMKNIFGWYRALEVTHNLKQNTYHPHFHCVLCVSDAYFDNNSRQYVQQKRWLEMWRKAMRDERITQVNIKAVRQTQDPKQLLAMLSEVCKYTLKTKELLKPESMCYSAELVQTLDYALHKRRLVAYGGLLKDTHKKLKLDDAIDGNLAKASDELPEGFVLVGQVSYLWHSGFSQYYGT